MEKSGLWGNGVVGIGIQKRSGHMFGTSAAALRDWWNFQVPELAGTKGKELTTVEIAPDKKAPIAAELFMGRLEDIIKNVNQGVLAIGIVSSDAIAEWEAASGEVLKDKGNIFTHDIGPAGSRLMIGVAEAYLKANPGADWRDAVRFSYQNSIPVVTTFKEELRAFLDDHDLREPPIEVRGGGVEAQARLFRTEKCPYGAPVIADLVASGQSMRDNGFVPITPIGDSRMLVIANTASQQASRPAMQRLLGRIVYGKPSIMDVNRLFLISGPVSAVA